MPINWSARGAGARHAPHRPHPLLLGPAPSRPCVRSLGGRGRATGHAHLLPPRPLTGPAPRGLTRVHWTSGSSLGGPAPSRGPLRVSGWPQEELALLSSRRPPRPREAPPTWPRPRGPAPVRWAAGRRRRAMRGSGARARANGGGGSHAGARRRRRRAALEVSEGCARSGGRGRSVASGTPGRGGWLGGEAPGRGARAGAAGPARGVSRAAQARLVRLSWKQGLSGARARFRGAGPAGQLQRVRAAWPEGSRRSPAATVPCGPPSPVPPTAASPELVSLAAPSERGACRWARSIGVRHPLLQGRGDNPPPRPQPILVFCSQ